MKYSLNLFVVSPLILGIFLTSCLKEVGLINPCSKNINIISSNIIDTAGGGIIIGGPALKHFNQNKDQVLIDFGTQDISHHDLHDYDKSTNQIIIEIPPSKGRVLGNLHLDMDFSKLEDQFEECVDFKFPFFYHLNLKNKTKKGSCGELLILEGGDFSGININLLKVIFFHDGVSNRDTISVEATKRGADQITAIIPPKPLEVPLKSYIQLRYNGKLLSTSSLEFNYLYSIVNNESNKIIFPDSIKVTPEDLVVVQIGGETSIFFPAKNQIFVVREDKDLLFSENKIEWFSGNIDGTKGDNPVKMTVNAKYDSPHRLISKGNELYLIDQTNGSGQIRGLNLSSKNIRNLAGNPSNSSACPEIVSTNPCNFSFCIIGDFAIHNNNFYITDIDKLELLQITLEDNDYCTFQKDGKTHWVNNVGTVSNLKKDFGCEPNLLTIHEFTQNIYVVLSDENKISVLNNVGNLVDEITIQDTPVDLNIEEISNVLFYLTKTSVNYLPLDSSDSEFNTIEIPNTTSIQKSKAMEMRLDLLNQKIIIYILQQNNSPNFPTIRRLELK